MSIFFNIDKSCKEKLPEKSRISVAYHYPYDIIPTVPYIRNIKNSVIAFFPKTTRRILVKHINIVHISKLDKIRLNFQRLFCSFKPSCCVLSMQCLEIAKHIPHLHLPVDLCETTKAS